MIMPRKMLYNFIANTYLCTNCYDIFKIDDFHFNKEIGFDECYNIELKIKEGILNKSKSISIDNCDFIKQINLIYNATSEHPDDYNEDDLFINKSKLISYKNNKITLELTNYKWEIIYVADNDTNISCFLYNLIRYSLYIAYYRYLKETNPTHKFVEFVEFLSKININESQMTTNIKEYIDSLIETENKIINERLFIDTYNKLKNPEI